MITRKTKALLITLACATFAHLSIASAQTPSATVQVRLSPVGNFTATTNEVSGFAVKNGSKVSANGIVVKLKTLKTGIELRDNHTQNYLQTDKFPEAVLVKADGENGQGTGILKIRGLQKNITGTYKTTETELEAQFSLKLSELGITKIKYMGVGVKDDVDLVVKVPLKK